MTERQQQVLTVIRAFVGANGYPPTVREIAERMHITGSTVAVHLAALENDGRIKRDPKRPRTIAIVGDATCSACGHTIGAA